MLSFKGNLLVTLLICFVCVGLHGQNLKQEFDYGLSFSSHEVTKDQRTSLNLNPERPFNIEGNFRLQFDFSLKRLRDAYGYVVRIIANDSLNIDLVSSPDHEDFHDLNLIINNSPTQIHFDHTDIGLEPMMWTTVVIDFESSKNQITLSWGGQTKSQFVPIDKLRSFRFFFGVNDFGKFNTADVPPMMLRNILVTNVAGKSLKWDLQRHGQGEVYDNEYKHVALTKNPTWLIDKHITWIHRTSFTIGNYPSVAFDEKDGEVIAIDEKKVYQYVLRTGEMKSTDVKAGTPVHTDANQLLYVKEKDQLVNYDLHSNTHSIFNFKTNAWEHTDTAYHEPNFWHNNKFYNAFDQSVYTFGGYGFFTYKNKFLRYDSSTHSWVEVKTSGAIPPRYLAALGLSPKKEKAFIFGGYGSKSGKQELFPQSFNDLYTFDLKTHKVEKLWEFGSDHPSEDLVFSNSLVVNDADSSFYVLSFPKNKHESFIKLHRYELNEPKFTILADSIPFAFHDEHSFCDLFLSEATKELIAVTSHKENDQYKVNVYSINYPPLSASDVFQQTKKNSSFASTLLIIIGGGLSALLLLFFLRKRKATEIHSIPANGSATSKSFSSLSGAAVLKSLPENEKVVSTLYLFGGFQVFDKNGHDITGKFTMTLKELFVLILLHSVKFEKGISTTTLQEHLWPDKDELSARNNRNVNIKKLRTLLEEVGNISIENNNAYLQLVIGDDVFCDYHAVSRILDNSNALDRSMVEVLLKYVKRGNLLPNIQTAWIDSFKSDISNRIIDTLIEYAKELNVTQDDRLLLDIADAIFNYDSINQEALVIKCSVLNKKGKHSLAKTWYDHFVKEYKTLYSENYPKTFEEVIS